jgi:hypothetical protein
MDHERTENTPLEEAGKRAFGVLTALVHAHEKGYLTEPIGIPGLDWDYIELTRHLLGNELYPQAIDQTAWAQGA